MIVAKSSLTKGARLAVYASSGRIAATPHIGRGFIAGGIRTCGDTPEIVTANADWIRFIATTLRNGIVNSCETAAYNAPQSLKPARTCA